MKPQKFEFSDLVDDYVIWKPNTNLISMIEEQIRSNGFYELDLDLQRSENRDGNLVAVFISENDALYFLDGGVKVIKDFKVHTKITGIEKVVIVKSSARYFKRNDQCSNESKQVFERFRYPFHKRKPEKWQYEKYIQQAIRENRALEASIGKRKIAPTTKYCIVFSYYDDIYDFIMDGIRKEGRFLYPGSEDIRNTKKAGEVLQSITILLSCGYMYYLVTPEYGTKNGKFVMYIKNLEPVALEINVMSKYRRTEVAHYHLLPKNIENPYFTGDESASYFRYEVFKKH